MSHIPPDNPTDGRGRDGELPPVEPPSARFLLQLFVVPGLIVTVIVTVWLTFGWLATKRHDPTKLVKGIRASSASRWQYAKLLADDLVGSRHPDLKRDSDTATELAEILKSEMESGRVDEEEVMLQVYLAKILGEFEVEAGMDELVEAAIDAGHLDVRLAAIEAISVRAQHVHDLKGLLTWDDSVTDTLLELSHSSSLPVRSRTAWTLGVVGSNAATERLVEMLDDPYADARYSAATGLARQGVLAAVEVLVEMLDPSETAGMDAEREVEFRLEKRKAVIKTALDASLLLAKGKRRDEIEPLVAAVGRLSQTDLPELADIQMYAKDVANKLP